MEIRQFCVSNIVEHIKHSSGLLGKEEGIRFGAPNAKVENILICWMADIAAINYAIQVKTDLIVTHESVLYPYDIFESEGAADFLSWETNHNRLKLLAENDITVVREHYSLDKLCIFDNFATILELGAPVISKGDFIKIYEPEESMNYGELINSVKEKFNLKTVRVTKGNKARKIKRIGLPWGGLGLFVNVGYMNKLVEWGCDTFIAGETDNYGFHFAVDAGVDMIETGHEISENPGLCHFSKELSKAFPNLNVEFFENKPPFAYE